MVWRSFRHCTFIVEEDLKQGKRSTKVIDLALFLPFARLLTCVDSWLSLSLAVRNEDTESVHSGVMGTMRMAEDFGVHSST